MPTTEIVVRLDEQTIDAMNQRCAALDKQPDDDTAEVIAEDAKRYQDELAEEGYRLLLADTGQFAAAAFPLAGEIWPEWKDAESGKTV